MGHSTLLISLSLITLLCGLSVAAYQLWSAETARRDGQPSALAARYGGKPRDARPPEPISPPVRDEFRAPPAPAPHPEADAIAVPPQQADGPDETPKRSPRAPRRKPKPDLTHNA